jgi:hypothetical protein
MRPRSARTRRVPKRGRSSYSQPNGRGSRPIAHSRPTPDPATHWRAPARRAESGVTDLSQKISTDPQSPESPLARPQRPSSAKNGYGSDALARADASPCPWVEALMTRQTPDNTARGESSRIFDRVSARTGADMPPDIAQAAANTSLTTNVRPRGRGGRTRDASARANASPRRGWPPPGRSKPL